MESFSFNDTMYHQVDGISMGLMLGLLANLFVGFLEQLLFKKVHKPCYIRYVDDTFAYFSSGNEAFNFLSEWTSASSDFHYGKKDNVTPLRRIDSFLYY